MGLRVYPIFYFKAFSTVCHKVLIGKLMKYGLDEPLFSGAQRQSRKQQAQSETQEALSEGQETLSL